jgi:hypothetical protein
MPDSRKRLADGAFLLALIVYMLIGTPQVPAHGDEYMQMAMARDWFALRRGDLDAITFREAPGLLAQTDPYMHLRLINGVIDKYLIGLAWELDGRREADLPGIYVWEQPLAWNVSRGNVPADDAVLLARWPSAILVALGVIPMFALGWHLRLRSLAYPAALLYALHPAILINGRRAMMEGGLILFSLAAMAWLVAVIFAEHSATASGIVRRLPAAARYTVLGLLIGLAVAAKYSGIIVAGAALTAALAAGLVRDRSWRRPLAPLVRVGWAAGIALLVWFALNPAYWRDPSGALRAMLSERAWLLETQAHGSPLTYTSAIQSLEALIIEPFLTAPQYYEAPTWAEVLNADVGAYQRSAVNGWDWGPVIGLILTGLALIGLIALVYDALHRDLIAWAILAWAGAAVVGSLPIPFAWQRYYLPLTLVAIVLAAEGLGRLLVRRSEVPAQASRSEAPPHLQPRLEGIEHG